MKEYPIYDEYELNGEERVVVTCPECGCVFDTTESDGCPRCDY